jgi:hypothetical protein
MCHAAMLAWAWYDKYYDNMIIGGMTSIKVSIKKVNWDFRDIGYLLNIYLVQEENEKYSVELKM